MSQESGSSAGMDANHTLKEWTVEEIKTLPELTMTSYLATVAPLATRIEAETGIYHLIPMVQSGHESRWGNSGLARSFGNLFGIVATDSWKKQGRPVAMMPTWEVINGKRIDTHREFRDYHSWLESFQDWAHIISTLSIYKTAYGLLKDKSTVRQGIRAMALLYATDPSYAAKLISLFDIAEKGENA